MIQSSAPGLSSLFASTSTAAPPTQNAGSSLFPNLGVPKPQGSLFGGLGQAQPQQPQQSGSLFPSLGQSAQPQQAGNLFSGFGASAQPQQAGNLGASTQPLQAGSLFSRPAQTQAGGSLFASIGPAQSVAGMQQSQGQNQQQNGQPAPNQAAYFDQMVERGKKRNNMENGGLGELPGLQLGLADIARKARNLGTGGPSAAEARADDTRA